jgi:succinoglycan biosynthesis transport protein ExoP
MSTSHETPSFGDYVSVVRRRRKLVALCAVVTTLFAAGYLWWSGPTYTSQASVVIRPILTGAFDQSRIDDVGAGTEAKVLDSTVVAAAAAKRLHENPADASALLEHLTVDNPLGTLILNISYDAASPKAAQDGAQAFADAYLSHRQQSADAIKSRGLERLAGERKQLETDLTAAQNTIAATPANSDARIAAEAARDRISTQISNLDTTSSSLAGVDTNPGQIIRPATRPDTTSGPGMLVTLLGAAVLGALLGVGLALVKERTDPRVRSRQALVDAIGAEPLVTIGQQAGDLAAVADPAGTLASGYRRLRVTAWPRRGTGPHRIIVTAVGRDAAPADLVAANVAATAQRAGWRTLLAWPGATESPIGSEVDLDTAWDGLDPDDAPLEKLVISAPGLDGVDLLPYLAGRERIGTPCDEIAERLTDLDGKYDVEMIVTDSAVKSPETYELAPIVDGTILVFDVERDTRKELERAIESLTAGGAPMVGVVAVGAPARW